MGRTKEEQAAYDRKYYLENKGKKNAAASKMYHEKYKHDPSFRSNKTQKTKERYHTNTIYKERSIIRALSRKKYPMTECEKCGSKEKLQRHHIEYKVDTIQILCVPCHSKIPKGDNHGR